MSDNQVPIKMLEPGDVFSLEGKIFKIPEISGSVKMMVENYQESHGYNLTIVQQISTGALFLRGSELFVEIMQSYKSKIELKLKEN